MEWEKLLDAVGDERHDIPFGVLRRIAAADLRGGAVECNDWLNDALEEGLWFNGEAWITRPPDGLKVEVCFMMVACVGLKRLPEGLPTKHGVDLSGCSSLLGLPEGFTSRWFLSLNGCSSLRTLPQRLDIRGDLDLRGCVAWDGRIPDDAQIGGVIVTGPDILDEDPLEEIPLERWREFRSHGMRT
jgi:hypothetical protein